MIKNYPTPRHVRQLKGFLGLVTFYTKFVRNFSAALLPLHRITQKNVKWEWGDTERSAFENVKELFEKHVVLAHPDPTKPYILRTDAYNNTLDAALGQIDEDGDERLITCIYRTLRSCEISYIVTEKELLAIVWSLQKLSTYLRGAKIYIKTDHQALVFLQRCKFSSERIRRWMLLIQEFDIEIEHVRGKDNIVPDVLTRHPQHMPNVREKPGEIILALICKKKLNFEIENFLRNISRFQEEDEDLQRFKKMAKEDPGEEDDIKATYLRENSILYKKGRTGEYLAMVPEKYQSKLIEAVHETYGHVGAKKTRSLIGSDFYVKNLRQKVAYIVSTCDMCQRSKTATHPSKEPMQNIIPDKPGELLSAIFMVPSQPLLEA